MSPPKKPPGRFDLALLFEQPAPARERNTHVEWRELNTPVEREALDKPRLPAKDKR